MLPVSSSATGATGMFMKLSIKLRDKSDTLHNRKVTNRNRLK